MTKPFTFCPACAAKLDDAGHEDERTCPHCGRTWYANSAPTVGAAIVEDDRVLLTVRGSEPEKGKYDIPGGFLMAGEDPIHGLRRELREELQIEIDVSLDDLVQIVPHVYGEKDEWVLTLGFVASRISGEPTAGSDVAEARWVTEEELEELDFAWEHDRELARKALKRD